MKVKLIVMFSLAFTACNVDRTAVPDRPSNSVNSNVVQVSPTQPMIENKIQTYDLKGSLGLLKWKGTRNTPIRFYNIDGSIWYEFEIEGWEAHPTNEELRPFRNQYDPEYFLLNTLGKDDRYYHVRVNDESGLIKYVLKNDDNFELTPWKTYVLDCYAVDSDPKNNPLKDAPNGKEIEGITENTGFYPIEIEGEWLKVGYADGNPPEKFDKFGWIKWKENDKLIVNLFEIA